jgi:hypothetical protein
MPDPTIPQSLYDALRNWANSTPPATRSSYDILKDFQAVFAAVVAVCGGVITARIAFRGATLNLSGILAGIEANQKAAALDRQRRKLGYYLRLKSQLQRFADDASRKAEGIKFNIDFLKKTEPMPDINMRDPSLDEALAYNDAASRRRISWNPERDVVEQIDELERAWKNIDLFPGRAVLRIDLLRFQLSSMQSIVDGPIARTFEDGKISDILAETYQESAVGAVHLANELIELLEEAILPLQDLG